MDDEFEQGFADAVNGEPEVAEPEVAEPEVAEQVEEEYQSDYEAAQGRIKELEHQAVSDSGRVSALTRKLQDPVPLQEGAPEESFDKWNTLQEEYPDIADGAAEKIGALEAKVERMVEERLAPLRELEEQRYVDGQIQMVASRYPDWQETVHSEDFDTWMGQQPLKVQDLRGSMESEDYIYLLKCYNADKSEQVEEIRSTRENQLKTNVAVPKRGPSRPSGPPDDFESAFAYYAQQD